MAPVNSREGLGEGKGAHSFTAGSGMNGKRAISSSGECIAGFCCNRSDIEWIH